MVSVRAHVYVSCVRVIVGVAFAVACVSRCVACSRASPRIGRPSQLPRVHCSAGGWCDMFRSCGVIDAPVVLIIVVVVVASRRRASTSSS
jgi:hypothetical protein